MALSINADLSRLPPLNLSSSGLAQTHEQGRPETTGDDAVSKTSPAVQLSPLGQASSLQTVMDGLNRGASIADAASAVGQAVAELLKQMQQTATAATQPSLGADKRSTLDGDFSALVKQIGAAVQDSGVGGSSLVDGSLTKNIRIATTADGSAGLSLSLHNLSLGGSIVSVSETASLATPAAAAKVLKQVNDSISSVNAAVSRIHTQADEIASQGDVISEVGFTQLGASGAAFGADGARLTALKVQQALSGSSASIASSSSQSILSLFKA